MERMGQLQYLRHQFGTQEIKRRLAQSDDYRTAMSDTVEALARELADTRVRGHAQVLFMQQPGAIVAHYIPTHPPPPPPTHAPQALLHEVVGQLRHLQASGSGGLHHPTPPRTSAAHDIPVIPEEEASAARDAPGTSTSYVLY
jgi:hypothetical protein